VYLSNEQVATVLVFFVCFSLLIRRTLCTPQATECCAARRQLRRRRSAKLRREVEMDDADMDADVMPEDATDASSGSDEECSNKGRRVHTSKRATPGRPRRIAWKKQSGIQ